MLVAFRWKTALPCAALLLALVAQSVYAADAKPLKVYILAGQSNMEGHAEARTFDYIGDDPQTKPLLDMMTDDQGKPVTADRVWVYDSASFYDKFGHVSGKLKVGFGGRTTPGELGTKIGPEYTFGLTMQEAYDGPILIIKTAWGGKSLHTDFRPPSAGPYELSDWQLKMYPKQEGHGIPKDFEQWKADKQKATGFYYRLMMEEVQTVLADPGKVVPGYNKAAGYELAGFVWFQGFNDYVDSHTYPYELGEHRYDQYGKLLETFIKDVRQDLNAPDLPFVIGVIGVHGPIEPGGKNKEMVLFRQAMAAPAKSMKNVVAVETAPYWNTRLAEIEENRNMIRYLPTRLKNKDRNTVNADGSMTEAEQKAYVEKLKQELISPDDEAFWVRAASNAGYHYFGCGKTLAQIGVAFANALNQADDSKK
ncbi:hypothetical protein GC197_03145 [bacterium]|nr:hypothetical protein [bacterium]